MNKAGRRCSNFVADSLPSGLFGTRLTAEFLAWRLQPQ
jgi:hypothetical protein